MSVILLLLIIAFLLVINVFLWKFGFIHSAEKPETLIDRPVMDEKERKAVIKRLRRWKEEGKLSREEYEHLTQLCASEWDPS